MPISALLHRNPLPEPKPHTLLPEQGCVGLELELEGCDHWPDVSGWTKVADNSLRDGIEYVFNGPQGGAKAVQSIKNMARIMAETQPNNSFRCSTHCHMDVSDLEFSELQKVVIAYTMMEPIMFQHCSLERRYSNFCTPFFQNTYLPRLFSQCLKNEQDIDKLRSLSAWPKYSALNLKPVTTYGSIEFRGSHALISEEELLGLPQRLLHLKRLCKEVDGSLIQFVESIRAMPMEQVFPTGLLIHPGAIDERLMDQSYASAIGIAVGNVSAVFNQVQQVRMQAPRPRVANPLVPINAIFLERYNLFRVAHMRLSELIYLVKHLRTMQGVERPVLRDAIVGNPANYDWAGGVNNLLLMMEQQRITAADLGLH